MTTGLCLSVPHFTKNFCLLANIYVEIFAYNLTRMIFFPCYLPYIYFQQRRFYGYYSILWRYTNLFSCNKYVNDNKRNVYCSGRRMMTMIHLNKFRPSSYLLQGSSATPCTIWLGERKVFSEEKEKKSQKTI